MSGADGRHFRTIGADRAVGLWCRRGAGAHAEKLTTYLINTEVRAEQPVAVRSATLAVADIGGWIGPTYGRVAQYLATHGSHPAGPPFARYRRIDDEKFEVSAGFPVPAAIAGDGDVHPMTLPGGPAAS